jgi:hypothetical protein
MDIRFLSICVSLHPGRMVLLAAASSMSANSVPPAAELFLVGISRSALITMHISSTATFSRKLSTEPMGARGQPVPVELHEYPTQKNVLPAGVYKETNSLRGDWEIAVKSPKERMPGYCAFRPNLTVRSRPSFCASMATRTPSTVRTTKKPPSSRSVTSVLRALHSIR